MPETNDFSRKEDLSPELEHVINDLTLFDDSLMGLVFDKNIPAAQLLLRIILECDKLTVLSVKGQQELKNPIIGGRNIRLDILAADAEGNHFNVEVQRKSSGAGFRRARFYSSTLDTRMLRKKQKFSCLKDSYVIFITEKDKLKAGLPLYHIERNIRETQTYINDGSHIIYVNGSYKGEDSIGKLIRDLHCTESSEMTYPELADGIRHFKETEGGRAFMSDKLDAYIKQKAAIAVQEAERKAAKKAKKVAKKNEKQRIDTLLTNVRNLMETLNLSMEQIFDALKLSVEDRKIVRKML